MKYWRFAPFPRTAKLNEPYDLEVQNLSKKLNSEQILKGLNFKIRSHGITGLVGPNGAGKTTLFNIMSNRMFFDEGAVFLNGVPHLDFSNLLFSYCPQLSYLDNALTVQENLEFYLRFKGFSHSSALRRTQELVEKYELGSFAHKQVLKLSAGMKKKISVVRAISAPAQFVLFDEPSAGLDASTRLWLMQVIRGLKEEGRCILISSHDLQEIDFLADHLIFLDRGAILASGRSEELILSMGFRRAIEVREHDAVESQTAFYTLDGRCVYLFSREEIANQFLITTGFRNYFLRDCNLTDFYCWKTGIVRER